MRVQMKYVTATRVRGKRYYYYRRDGKTWGRLKGEPGSRQFLADYHRIDATFRGDNRTDIPNSFADVLAQYLAAPEYRDLKDTTKQSYRSVIDQMRDVLGPADIRDIRRSHVKAYRDKMQDRPGMANLSLAVMRNVFNYAIDLDLIRANPVQGVRTLRTGSHSPWPEDAIADVIENAPAHIARAVVLALHTGQRKGDVLKMRWSDIEDGGIWVRQQKTGTKLWIPMHPDLAAAVHAFPRQAVTILCAPSGRVWTRGNFDTQFRAAMRALGHKYVMHGLRHNAATRLAEAGATDAEAASITGHKSAQVLQGYRRHAEQKTLAKTAMQKLTAKLQNKRG